MSRQMRRWLTGSCNPARPVRRPRLGLQALEGREVPASFVVSNLNDSGAGSLRQAISSANGAAGLDTISFTVNGTITLGSTLTISDSVIITGNGVGNTTVSGNNSVRIFDINGAGTLDVTLSGMTLTKGKSTTGSGAAIQNTGENLTIANCVLTGNTTAGNAGAIYVNGGKLTLSDSTVSANSAFYFGGGIYFNGGATAAITNCTISGNSSSNSGGGVSGGSGTLTVTNSVVTGNSAANGGGIDAFNINFTLQSTTVSNNTTGGNGGGLLITGGTTTITNSTVSGNKANEGGGLFLTGNVGTATIRNLTVANNTATGGGGGVFFQSVTGTVNLSNSTISGNAANGTTGGGLLTYLGNPTVNLESSVISGNTGPFGKDFARYAGTLNVTKCAFEFTSNTFTDKGGNIVGPHANLKLSLLASNGGPVQTFRPQTGSPLINAGSNPGGLTTDARGVSRSIGTTDIGAVEVATAIVVTTTADAGDGSLRQAILDANLDGNVGASTPATITFDTAGAFKSAATITLTTGEMVISDSITINGTGFDKLTLDGNNASRIFNTNPAPNGTSITFNNMTMTKGKATGDGGAIFVGEEALTLNGCVVSASTASFDGGGINVESAGPATLARLVLDGSTVSGNSAGDDGGGVYFNNGGSFLIRNSTLLGNKAADTGGSLYFFGAATAGGIILSQTTISGNSSGATGGGIVLRGGSGSGTLLVHSATIVENTASVGGGISRDAGAFVIDVQSSIVSGNSGTNPDISSSGTVTAKFSAIGSNTGFTLTDQGNNLPFQPHANLKLGPIISAGTAAGFFHAPGIESPLVDAGSNPSGFGNDIRGDFRTIGVQPDIGNVEIRNFVVLNAANTGGGSLRQAVQHAFSNNFNGTVTFDGSVNGKTITLASEIAIDDSVVISGPGASQVTLSGGGTNRIFRLNNPTTQSTISGLTLTNGKAAVHGGAIYFTDASLTVNDCVISNNTATNSGGGIGGFAPLTIARTTFSNNKASIDAGAFFSYGVTLTDSTLVGNTASNRGGAMLFSLPAAGSFVIRNSTISGNSATVGAAAIALGYLSGIEFDSTLTVQNSTIVNNSAPAGGAIQLAFGNGTIALESTIVSGNSSPNQIQSIKTVTAKNSAIASALGFSLTDQGGNIINTPHANLKLGALANNGGPTQTHLPLPGSPLVDAGSNPDSLTSDQRGNQRTVGSKTDIGATETVNFVVLNTNNAGPGSLRQTIEHANSLAGADTVTFDSMVFATPQTITLVNQLSITDAMIVTGPGARLATVSGNNAVRIMSVNTPLTGQSVTLSGLTFANGKATQNAGIGNNDETLTLVDCVLTGNTSSGEVGALAVYNLPGSLTLIGCTVSGNSASGSGGAIFGNPATSITIRNSTIANNTSGGSGGAVLQNGSLTVQNSTFVGNSAGGEGGAVFVVGTASIESSIVSGNSAVGLGADVRGNTVTVTNSAIGSTAGFGLDNKGGNILNQPHASLKLGSLANNGGPTNTILPAIDSPLVGKGSNPASLVNDQRGVGFGRVRSGITDIGAVEAATSFIVLNANNSGVGSLRQAVLDANAFVGADSITFDPTFFATPRTILGNGNELNITDSVTITGPGAAFATFDTAKLSRHFSIDGVNNTVNISGLTLTGGNGGGTLSNGAGGAIKADGDILTLTDCVVTGNTASLSGGGIRFFGGGGSLTLVRTRLTNNITTNQGGGFLSDGAATVTITDSTIDGNTANTGGGGGFALFGGGSLVMTGSAVSNNRVLSAGAQGGGGIHLQSTLSLATIRNSSISGNSSASAGGGIALSSSSSGTLLIQNSTITNNTANGGSGGGGIARNGGGVGVTINTVSTIVSGNSATVAGPDIFTTGAVNATTTLLGSAAGITTINADAVTTLLLGKAANLGPLANNGGPTQTHALLPNSPAIGQGSNPAPALTLDQRGRPRVVGNIDIGAFELQPGAKVATVVVNDGSAQRSTVTSVKVSFDSPVTFTGSAADAFTLTRQKDSSAVTLNAAVDNSGPGTVVTLTFTGGPVDAKSLADGRYTLNVLAGQIGGDGLDGNGDGTAGDNYTLVGDKTNKLFRLFGDANGNGQVGTDDFLAFRLAFLSSNPTFDFTGNGTVDAADFLQFRLRFLASV